MNIFYDARWTRFPFHDGISRYGAGIIQGFKDNKIPVTLLIKDKRQLKMLPSDVPYLLVNDPLSVKELFIAKKLNKLGANAVISPFQIIGTWGRKYKLIVTLHDTIYYLHPQAPTNMALAQRVVWRLFHMAKWPQRFLLNNADKVATVSNYSKSNIQKLNLTDREICVIYNAPSLDESQLHRAKEKTKDILYMGSFMPYKNVEVLIKGMADLPGFTLHLLSKILDNRRTELSKLIAPGVNVVFHNGVSDDEYIKLLQSAFCSASASKEEGFGLPIIEAQTIGTPVVCSDMTIFHEVAGNGALFFDFNSPEQFAKQVLKLNDLQFEKNLVEKGHKQAEKFTWKQSAKKLYDICQELVA
ncbi:MAG TPA: glycosyltransferase family 1 protein [Candidatus Saccharimonadales bacterium]|nr:glycosyltransferase family 1 protein [Candidatus Saccharimonadales bacterium]